MSSFEAIRQTLLQERFQDRLTKPLVYWALPDDRRLPLAFLNRSIGDLVNTPFEELTATPGVGHKKISSLMKLLNRATSDQPPNVTFGINGDFVGPGSITRIDAPEFNASLVSEALWSEWTSLVRDRGLGDETLGRVAESLDSMPTVIWTKRLDEYENLTLAQIRGLRTHGEKRVRCVLRVFHRVYQIAKRDSSEPSTLRQRLGSQRIVAVEKWVKQQLVDGFVPQPDDVRISLAEPILEQIAIDCGQSMHRIAQQRLGINEEQMSVREQAQALGVTRARVYQLLDDCHKVLEVRWPGGRALLDRMTALYGSYLGSQQMDASLFLALRQLCFPDRSEYERGDMRPIDLEGSRLG